MRGEGIVAELEATPLKAQALARRDRSPDLPYCGVILRECGSACVPFSQSRYFTQSYKGFPLSTV